MGGSGTPGLFLGQDHGTNTDYLYDDNGTRRGQRPRRGRGPHLTRKDDGTNTHE